MNGQKKGPLEGEFRSSQLYRTLTGAGIPGGRAIAESLGSAAGSVDNAIGSVGRTVQQGVRQAQSAVQAASRQQPGESQPTGPNQTTYHYSYVRPTDPRQTAQTNRQKAQAARAAQQAQTQQTRQAPAVQQPQQNLKLVKKGSRAKYYITGATALLYALNLPLESPIHFALFGLALVGAYLLSGKLFQGKSEWVPVETPAAQPKPQEQKKKEEPVQAASQTGNPEVDKIINDGNRYLKQLRAANDAIPEEALSEDIDRMERASADIFRFIADHPDKAGEIRKFMNYYLPTTLKLLNSYQRLSRQSAKGENITSTMFNIAGMMHTVADAFEKQLDSLFTDEAMDVSADISVFETLLKQEGFVEEPVKKAQKQSNRKDEQQ